MCAVSGHQNVISYNSNNDRSNALRAVSGHQNVISYNDAVADIDGHRAVSGHQNVISYNPSNGEPLFFTLCLDIKT